jgi:pimeloyl-ACP methyl ester carboxylesterase
VLFFHRTPVTSASFIRVMEHLGGWRRLVAFDTPGFGESFTPTAGTTMATFTGAFLQAINALGIDRFHLVGHHTGAHFATEIALAAPDRTLSLMLDGAMVLSAEQRAQASAPPPVVVDEDGAYAAGAWKFLRPYYTVFDARCIHDEFVGALSSTFTRDACMALVRVHDMAAQVARVKCPVIASAAQDEKPIGP